jgi:thiosulfate/3-mercaptopyruvate sulfurtransferase
VLVDTQWLADHEGDETVVPVDMRWRGDGSGRELYDAGHIPGAVHLDWSTDLIDPQNPVAFMLGSPERFAEVMERSGIGDHSTVVAYSDQEGSGPHRLWWASRVYGHDNVHVLDGGLEKWVREGRSLTSDPPPARSASWTPRATRRYVATAADVEYATGRPDVVVLDSRPPEQFRGEAVWFETGPVAAGPDGVAHTPRGDIRGGRIPGAVNVPVASLYRPDSTMKRPEELRALLSEAGLIPGCGAITYCGVGLSASALLFAMHIAGYEDASLYDASWEEWGRDESRPAIRD